MAFGNAVSMLLANALLFGLLILGADAQPVDWPPLAKLPAVAEQGFLRGAVAVDMQWTPVSSVDGQQVIDPALDQDLLSEVETALDAKLGGDQLAVFEETLRSTFESLQKNEYGNLGHTAVRYALHRLFVARHGWMIKGLNPAGKHFNSTSPVQVLAGKVPVHVQGLFERRLGGKGFRVQDVAVFASLLEKLISDEATERLAIVLRKFGFSTKRPMPLKDAQFIMEIYMSAFILGTEMKTTRRHILLADRDQMWDLYSAWNDAKELVNQIRSEIVGSKTTLTISDIEAVLVKFGELFGQWQNKECADQKARLMKLEDGEKGCVPISSFYKPMVRSNGQDWHFSETPQYLSALGIVDGRDPVNMKVMIPNYLNAASNCIATSHYYFICCVDECESLLGNIERHFQMPAVLPSDLAAFVSEMPSSTEPNKRRFSSLQLKRLDSIAERHGGRVPIHGRLFMQWMHNVYPRECAYPHLSGTSTSLSPDEWLDLTGMEANASLAEMRSVRRAASKAPHNDAHNDGQCGRWNDDEELLVNVHAHRRSLRDLETDVQTWVAASSVALLCALASVSLALISIAKSLKRSLSWTWKDEQRFMVI